MEAILKGDISISNDLTFIRELLSNQGSPVKVIDLSESGLPKDHPNVLNGQLLLPPIESLIAEQDGDEVVYDAAYFDHFNKPFVRQFMDALIAYLYTGNGNLLLYYPELNTNTVPKLRQLMWQTYGICPGVLGREAVKYDYSCVPLWLATVYSLNMIKSYEFLRLFPNEAMLSDPIIDRLLYEINPYGKNLEEKVLMLVKLRADLKQKSNVRLPFQYHTEGG